MNAPPYYLPAIETTPSRLASLATGGVRRWVSLGVAVALIVCLAAALIEGRWLRPDLVLWIAPWVGIAAGLVAAAIFRRWGVAVIAVILAAGVFSAAYHSRALPPVIPAAREAVEWAAAADAWEKIEAKGETILPVWSAAQGRWDLYVYNLRAEWPPPIHPNRKQGQVLTGTILTAMLASAAGLIAWIAARGRSIWGGLALILALMAANVYLSGAGWWVLLAAMCLGVLWGGETALRGVEGRWPPGARYDWLVSDWWIWLVSMLLPVGGVMALAITLTDPALTDRLTEIIRPAAPITTREYRPPRSPGGSRDALEAIRAGVWPREHLLGAGPELAERPVMIIHTPGSPPGSFYWRATSYDEYTGRGWLQNTVEDLPADLWPESTDPPPGYALLRQDVELELPTSQIYAAGRPVRLSLPAEPIWLDVEDTPDLVAMRGLTQQAGYQVLAWVPAADADDLRAAAGELPLALAQRYVQLPGTLPRRVSGLAAEITRDAPTVYDKALAIQNYLREYPYTLEVGAPPSDSDVVEWFLFDQQEGYCDYYASAMVVLARAAGLPARLAVGYQTGTYDPEIDAYRVTQANAHSWPEVYFAGIGWVRFEPTPAYPASEPGLPPDWGGWQPAANAVPEDEPQWNTVEPSARRVGRSVLWIGGGVIGALAVIWGSSAALDAWRESRRRRLPPADLLASLYRDLVRQARRIGVTAHDYDTPYEFLPMFASALKARGLADRVGDQARALVDVYVEGYYSARKPTREGVDRALAAWWGVRRGMRVAWWIRRRKKN